jgi:prepilin peptidase CpaA
MKNDLYIDIVTIVLLFIAMINDLKYRKIPNVITFPAIGLGLFLNTILLGKQGLFLSLAGFLLAGGLFLIFYLIGGMGAGDVKLMGAVGSLLGIEKVIFALILTSVVGGLMSTFIIFRFYLKRLKLKNSNIKKFQDKSSQIDSKGPLKLSMPYGVAIAFGSILTIILI